MIIDLFAGPGGWDEGIRKIDSELKVIGIEFNEDACSTAISAGHGRIHSDVRLVNRSLFTKIDGLVASPPCQGFSVSGLKSGIGDSSLLMKKLEYLDFSQDEYRDKRSALMLEPLGWSLDLRPRWLAFEQGCSTFVAKDGRNSRKSRLQYLVRAFVRRPIWSTTGA